MQGSGVRRGRRLWSIGLESNAVVSDRVHIDGAFGFLQHMISPVLPKEAV